MYSPKDLSGERFGYLTVLKKADGLENRYYRWHCRCDCGNEITVSTKNLTSGRTTHCGCRTKELRNAHLTPKDRTGDKYGALTALQMIGTSEKGEFLWECECKCGKHAVFPAKQLQKGTVSDCGCGIGQKTRYKDISGARKGQLTALYATDKRDGKGSVIWHCRCDCGNEIDISESDFMFGGYVSCGCVRQQRLEECIPAELLTFVDGTCVEWLAKRKKRSDNTSGFRGVYKSGSSLYRVYIGLQGKRYYLGSYKNYEDAVAVRLSVENYLHAGFVSCWNLWMEKAAEDEQWASENPFFFTVEKDRRNFRVTSAVSEESLFQY